MAPIPPLAAILRARSSVRRSALRHQLQAIAAGKSTHTALDLDDAGLDAAGVVEEFAAGLEPQSFEMQLLLVAFRDSSAADAVVERMSAKSVRDRVNAARIAGALRMYDTTRWLSQLLSARDPSVADAAARALGKIGGARSATALLTAIQRRGVNRRLVCELARCAPDLFIEVALAEPPKPGVRPALAIAAGLRRRHTAMGQLISMLQHGSRREKVISCRALGWIGAGPAIPIIRDALNDRDWKVRMSAAKALGSLHAVSCRREVEFLVMIDRNPRVRQAARQALYRIDHGASREQLRGA
jgi:HEAT repeat protein